MNAISIAVEKVGGPISAAEICGIRRQAIDKWLARGSLPRTEYTGETNYASRLADASNGDFTAEWLLAAAAPTKSAAALSGSRKPALAGERRSPRKPADRRGRRDTDLSTQEAKELLESAEKIAGTLQRIAKD
ncbi:hypothetical protein [Stutzerimonas xanthomarina]|uniref:Uncharacterized protein n=2 Tax=Stutzerimonas xanthomarina TaxID=271420 RepID=A0A1M5MQ95_9GAMM|nr:hypothetical protein SAMN05216535_2389 [Stutzerimonas xanthomarina]SHG79570.1 hypothetical protein SAMN02744645_1428 [Stutzerimonas xanthomarina DSM 18231]